MDNFLNLRNKIDFLLKKYEFNYENKIVDKFTEFISLLIEENTKYNLASIKDIDVFLEKTFIDSLIPLKYLGNIKGNLIDIGSGNGFPGVILGIVCEDLNVVLCDAETKKIRFLDKACELLGNRFQTLHGRAEDNISYFNKFDFVCAKALVSKADKWLKWTIPYLAPNGISVNYKTKVFNDDLELAVTKSYMKKKKCELIHSIPYKVADVEREVFFIRKLCTKKI